MSGVEASSELAEWGVWASVAAAGFAAVAAGLALWTALMNRTLVRAATLPELGAINVVGGAPRLLEITNGGGGLASYIHVVWVVDPHVVEADVAAYLKAGDQLRVAAVMDPSPDAVGCAVLLCRDARGDRHGWSGDGEHTVVRRRPWRKTPALDPRAFFSDAYPDIDLDRLEAADHTIPMRLSEGYASSSYPKGLFVAAEEDADDEASG
jgi:hypothetical protein